MNKRDKFLHALGSIVACAVVLIVAVVTFAVCMHFANGQAFSFALGVIGGIISSLVFKVYDRYLESCQVYKRILYMVDNLIADFMADEANSYDQCKNNEKGLLHSYSEMCRESSRLTYKYDFRLISEAVNDLISATIKGEKTNIIKERLEKLIDIRRELD